MFLICSNLIKIISLSVKKTVTTSHCVVEPIKYNTENTNSIILNGEILEQVNFYILWNDHR